jgi:AraC-like DNA-binding protein
MPPTALLDRWQAHAEGLTVSPVYPDGCRDLILRQRPKHAPQWFVSPLVVSAYAVTAMPGESLTGFRLRPAAVVRESQLVAAVRCLSSPDDARVLDSIEVHAPVDPRLDEALLALAQSSRVAVAARALGVGERTLQRCVMGRTGHTPATWLALARARRAAHAMAAQPRLPLAELALHGGYADQAHMGREFSRWFSCPPGRLARHPDWLDVAAASGYGQAIAHQV